MERVHNDRIKGKGMEGASMKTKNCKCDIHYACKACRPVDIYTYEQIASVLGITHQAVWEIERRALKKLAYNFKLLGYNSLEDIL